MSLLPVIDDCESAMDVRERAREVINRRKKMRAVVTPPPVVIKQAPPLPPPEVIAPPVVEEKSASIHIEELPQFLSYRNNGSSIFDFGPTPHLRDIVTETARYFNLSVFEM